MLQSDVNRRCVCYDRKPGEGNGLLGTITEIIDDWTFRLTTDSGSEYLISIKPRTDGSFTPWVKFIDNQEVRQ